MMWNVFGSFGTDFGRSQPHFLNDFSIQRSEVLNGLSKEKMLPLMLLKFICYG